MDDFCQYKLFKIPRPPLLKPPPYIRESEGFVDTEPTKPHNLHLRASDPSKLLLLLDSLKDSTTRDLEVKINLYLKENLNSQVAFMMSLMLTDNSAVVRVINSHILNMDIILLMASNEMISTLIGNKSGIEFSLDGLNQKLLAVIKELVPNVTGDVFGFPIFKQTHEKGITKDTETPLLLMFIINCTQQRIFISDLVKETFRFCLPLLENTTRMEEETRLKIQSQMVLTVVMKMFAALTNFDELLKEIREDYCWITSSQKCLIYVLDASRKSLEQLVTNNEKGNALEKLEKDKGIEGYVFTTGSVLNVNDAYNHALFNKALEKKGEKTVNILCFPIKTLDSGVFGVVELKNKTSGEFTRGDEELANLLGFITGIAITHARFIETTNSEVFRNRITTEMMICYGEVKEAEIKHIRYAQIPEQMDFGDIHLNPRTIPSHRMPLYIMKIYEDLGLIEKFQIDRRKLAAFIANVEHAYVKEPFHNFQHAFCSVYFAYSLIITYKMINKKMLSELEILALLTSLLCLDLDHKATSSSYHGQPWSTLANLFSSNGSIFEQYHFALMAAILNREGCNFMDNLSKKDYRRCLEMMRANILASDLAHHLKLLRREEIMAMRGFRANIVEDRFYLNCILVVCSCLSDQVRDWKTSRLIAAQLFTELFEQGSLEEMMQKEPPTMMERTKTLIPDLQIDFLRDICLPVFTVLAKLIPKTVFHVEALLLNIRFWEEAKKHFARRNVLHVTSMELLLSRTLSFTEPQIGHLNIEHVSEEESLPDTSYYDSDR